MGDDGEEAVLVLVQSLQFCESPAQFQVGHNLSAENLKGVFLVWLEHPSDAVEGAQRSKNLSARRNQGLASVEPNVGGSGNQRIVSEPSVFGRVGNFKDFGLFDGVGAEGYVSRGFSHLDSDRGLEPLAVTVNKSDERDRRLADHGGESAEVVVLFLEFRVENLVRPKGRQPLFFILQHRCRNHNVSVVLSSRARKATSSLTSSLKSVTLESMKITLNRLEAPFYLEARNEEGNALTIDASPSIGGTGRGFRPMETLLAGLAGCSAIDVVVILQKSRQPLDDIQVEVEGHRQEGVEPSLFDKIHVCYRLKGAFEDQVAQRAVDWSMEKYCSVAKTLEKTATITWAWERME